MKVDLVLKYEHTQFIRASPAKGVWFFLLLDTFSYHRRAGSVVGRVPVTKTEGQNPEG